MAACNIPAASTVFQLTSDFSYIRTKWRELLKACLISHFLQVNINLRKYFWQWNWQCIIHIKHTKSKCHKNLCIENIKKERNTDLEISKPCRWRLHSFKVLGTDYPAMHHILEKVFNHTTLKNSSREFCSCSKYCISLQLHYRKITAWQRILCNGNELSDCMRKQVSGLKGASNMYIHVAY